jgi:pimeloyl-ACP methyl ester carboxylesterase
MTAGTGRLWARLARGLAGSGSWVIRLDFTGSGDSSGEFERRHDGQPAADVAAGIDELMGRGAERLVVAGHCFGAVPAMALAVVRPAVRRVVLLSPPLTWVQRGQTVIQAGGPAPLGAVVRSTLTREVASRFVTDPEYRRWLARRARRRVRSLAPTVRRAPADAGVPGDSTATGRVLLGKEWLGQLTRNGVGVTIVYGSEDWMYADFLAACEGGLSSVISDPAVEVVLHPESIHALDRSSAQDVVAAQVTAAVRALAG